MPKPLAALTLLAALFIPACDQADDPEIERMARICAEVPDCDAAIEAYLAEIEEDDELDFRAPEAEGGYPPYEPKYGFTDNEPDPEVEPVDDLRAPQTEPDPDPYRRPI